MDSSVDVWDGHRDVSWDGEGLSSCPDDGCAALGVALDMWQLGLHVGDALGAWWAMHRG